MSISSVAPRCSKQTHPSVWVSFVAIVRMKIALILGFHKILWKPLKVAVLIGNEQ